jgi:hypothetical protein
MFVYTSTGQALFGGFVLLGGKLGLVFLITCCKSSIYHIGTQESP